MSNELTTTKIAYCPSDKMSAPPNFSGYFLSNSLVVDWDATEIYPSAPLVMDRNLTANANAAIPALISVSSAALTGNAGDLTMYTTATYASTFGFANMHATRRVTSVLQTAVCSNTPPPASRVHSPTRCPEWHVLMLSSGLGTKTSIN